MYKFPALLLTAAILATTASSPVLAEEWHDHGDIHHFHEHDYDHWRGGHWIRGLHGNRDGWWWVVDGLWYYYPAPIYPYPDPYTPPAVVVTTPAPVVTQVAPSAVYYCANPPGYYPYVPQCYVPWQKMASAPPAVVVVNQHDVDARQLSTYAQEFAHINLADPHARVALKSLARHVENFRHALTHRNYNAMDILRNTEDLSHRIAEQRAALAPHVAPPVAAPGNVVIMPPVAAPVTTVPPPPPTSAPPPPPPVAPPGSSPPQ